MNTSRCVRLGAGLIAWHLGASAAIITFTFDSSENNQTAFTKTVSGLTLSAGNPNSSSGKFAADSDGLLLVNDPSQGPDSFEFSFSSAVQMVSCTVGFALDGTSGSFMLSRTGESSTLNELGTMGSFPIHGTFNPAANQTVFLTSNPIGSPGWSQIKSFTVNTVPEPPETLAFVGLACGLVAWLLRSKMPPLMIWA